MRRNFFYKIKKIYWQVNINIVSLYYASNTMTERVDVVNYEFNNDRPIYIQLVEILRLEIVSGKLKQGEKIPSVRELALIMKVNPNTMQKALQELEKERLIFTERTNGKFVTNDKMLIEKVKKELALEKINTYLDGMKSLGIEKEKAIQYLHELGGK